MKEIFHTRTGPENYVPLMNAIMYISLSSSADSHRWFVAKRIRQSE